MRHLFIINPVAGGGNQSTELSGQIGRALLKYDPDADFEIYVTKAPLDATRKIREDAEKYDALRVYACGGDGTLNECVCGAAEKPNVAVTHYPCGTGNDFIKAFGMEKERFFSLEELLAGETRAIDVIRVADRYSINICSVGIDARIGCNVHNYSNIPVIGGSAGYLISTAVEVVKGVSRPIRATINGKVYDGDKTLICVCNGTCYGGFFKPVPEARVDDGVLDVLVVKGVSRLTFARLVGGYAKGRYQNFTKQIEHVCAKDVDIEADEELMVNLDGEALHAKHLEMSVIPKGVNFVFPANMEYFRFSDEKTSKIER